MLSNYVEILIPLLLCASSIYSLESVSRYEYVTKRFSVPVDHFSFSLKRNFEMRYLVNDTWQRGENPPIFFYTGNEEEVTHFVKTSGFMYDIAPTFGALIVFAEHRYYGESLPAGKPATLIVENLGFLTSQQALADYVDLIEFLRSNPALKHSPVIAFGGSYGGMLSTWIRMKYPHIVQGAIASSAPMLLLDPTSDCHGYYRTVTDVFRAANANCPKIIRRSWGAIDNITSTVEGREWLSAEWKLCKPIENMGDAEQLKNWLSSSYTTLATKNDPYPSGKLPAYPIIEFCKFLKNTTADSDAVILSSLREAIKLFAKNFAETGCIDLPELNIHEILWFYQQCSEMSIYQCADGISDMFEFIPADFGRVARLCEELFYVRPQADLACKIYGCSDFSMTSNIIFSNGLLDPWHTGGILKNVSDSVIAVIIPEGAHQLDLAGSHPGDPQSVIDARNVHKLFITEWIQQYREKFTKQSLK
ncbi:lysosomal Pro-X carboxypeptidase [Diachasma alloeum]|uniref:lysosomal Pro-X carboxypeptidase n=1 Tax=Diachasma alloeum TaxID=454923 RepID=UPI000738272C|nr:lysosomal Pro-X carboxypeptidase [Diachasma alloeum]